jgi:hypothetical protein
MTSRDIKELEIKNILLPESWIRIELGNKEFKYIMKELAKLVLKDKANKYILDVDNKIVFMSRRNTE